jgi:hypothetical protein
MSRRSVPYGPMFLEVAEATIARYRELGLEEKRCTIAGVANATFGNSFAVATRRTIGGNKRVPEWVARGWAIASSLDLETVCQAIEADGCVIIAGRPRADSLDPDGIGERNFKRGWFAVADGRIEYDLAKYEADRKQDAADELARYQKSGR